MTSDTAAAAAVRLTDRPGHVHVPQVSHKLLLLGAVRSEQLSAPYRTSDVCEASLDAVEPANRVRVEDTRRAARRRRRWRRW